MEAEDHSDPLFIRLLVVRRAEERERRPVRADRGLDDVGDEPLVRGLVEVLELLAGVLGVTAEVEVRPVMDPFELLPAERVVELDVEGPRSVMGPLVLRVLTEPEELVVAGEVSEPLTPRLHPFLVVARGVGRPAEVLHLHLLELARAEDEVPRGDLVAE